MDDIDTDTDTIRTTPEPSTDSDGPVPPAEDEALCAALAARTAENAALLARLREALAAADPALQPEMLAGETLAEVEASLAAARETVRRVREAVRREAPPAIPGGAPARQVEAPASPFDKIRAGLARLPRP